MSTAYDGLKVQPPVMQHLKPGNLDVNRNEPRGNP